MTSTYHRQIIKARSPQVFSGMLTTGVQIRLLDNQVNHPDGIVFMCDQPLDGVGDDRALTRHQTFANPVVNEGKGFLLLIPHKLACPFLSRMVILGIIFSL